MPGREMSEVTRPTSEGETDLGAAHSFLIRFWREASGPEPNRLVWHGHITHVMSRARSPIEDLDDIKSFVKPFLYGGEEPS